MLNMLSLFSGIGAFERALENVGIAYNLVGYCEIDKYEVKPTPFCTESQKA